MEQPWMSDNYYVSPANYLPEVIGSYHISSALKIHDVTLRDGEQQIGVGFRKEEKIMIGEKLAEAGVHRIEAGMPATSPNDAAAIREIVNRCPGTEVYAFCRSVVDDIKIARDCGVHGVVVEIPSSEHMITYSYQWTVEKAVDLVVKATSLAHELGLQVALFTMDSTRARFEWLADLIKAVQKDGHFDTVAIVDTQGVTTPTAVRYLVRKLKEITQTPIEAHFHNDLGLANANTLAAVEEGAEVIHTTVLGMGPRAGQASTEQIAVILKLLYGLDIGISLDKLYELSQTVARLAPHRIASNQPLVGDSVYKIESGIPASWWMRIHNDHPLAFYGMLPSLVGAKDVEIVLGKGSGVPSINYWLQKLGLPVPADCVPTILAEVKKLAVEKKGLVTSEEFKEIAARVGGQG